MKRTGRIAVVALAATGATAGAAAAMAAPAWLNPTPNHGSTMVADVSARSTAAGSQAPSPAPTQGANPADGQAQASLTALQKREQELRDRLASQSAAAQGNGVQVVDGQVTDPGAPTGDTGSASSGDASGSSQTSQPEADPTPASGPTRDPIVVTPTKRPPSQHSTSGASGGGWGTGTGAGGSTRPGAGSGDDEGEGEYEGDDEGEGRGGEGAEDDAWNRPETRPSRTQTPAPIEHRDDNGSGEGEDD